MQSYCTVDIFGGYPKPSVQSELLNIDLFCLWKGKRLKGYSFPLVELSQQLGNILIQFTSSCAKLKALWRKSEQTICMDDSGGNRPRETAIGKKLCIRVLERLSFIGFILLMALLASGDT